MERVEYSRMWDKGENWFSLLRQDDEHTQMMELLRNAIEKDTEKFKRTEKLKKYLESWIFEDVELIAYYPSSGNPQPDGFIKIGSITDGVIGYVDNYNPPRDHNTPRP